MKQSYAVVAIILIIAVVLFSCTPTCNKVTGPHDVSYTEISAPDCISNSIPYNGTYLINSASDFIAICPAGTTPTAWDFTNKTYLVFSVGYGDTVPYIAGVGSDPGDPTRIDVIVGIPCNPSWITLDTEHIKTFTLEISKTAKTFITIVRDEQPK